MRRRDFLAGFAGTAVIAPGPTRAQGAFLIVGCLDSRSADGATSRVAALLRGLEETGHFPGRNVAIEYRWADDHDERLPGLAFDLAGRNVAVIVTPASALAARAAQAATTTIPIVFGIGSDPVKLGLVTSLNRPGGNITGVVRQSHELGAKRLELLHTLAPVATPIAVLINPTNPASKDEVEELEGAAHILGVRVGVFNARSKVEIDTAFTSLAEKGYRALIVSSDNFFNGSSKQIAALAARYGLPASYAYRTYAEQGGLMSYGPDNIDSWRLVAIYAGRILSGVKPADLPVTQPTKFEMVINMKTAKTLGLTIPPNLLAIADEVIE